MIATAGDLDRRAVGLAAITTAYSVFRNEQHNHEASIRFNEGIVQISEAAALNTQGNQEYVDDQQLVLE